MLEMWEAAGMKSAWLRVATIALRYDVPVRGYGPLEIIAMCKYAKNISTRDIQKLKQIVREWPEPSISYGKIKPRYWRPKR